MYIYVQEELFYNYVQEELFYNYVQEEFFYNYVRVNIDEDLLKKISRETGGRYYRATNEEELRSVYDEIDALEKTEIELNVFKRYSEEFEFFVWIGFIIILIEILLKYTYVRTMPV